jgi:hypothetical protein
MPLTSNQRPYFIASHWRHAEAVIIRVSPHRHGSGMRRESFSINGSTILLPLDNCKKKK